jgi:peptidylprolyl isomerase
MVSLASSLRRALRAPLLLVPLTVLAGCGEDLVEPVQTGPQTPADVAYDPSLGVVLDDMTILPSGVYIQTLEEGDLESDPVTSGTVSVDYTLWLPNGRQIDSSLVSGRDPLSFTFGAGSVIPGFEQGVSGMRVGELRRILVPSELGYGDRTNGAIPANSVLVFEVELVSVEADPLA